MKRTIDSINPRTGKVIKSVSVTTERDYEKSMQAASKAFLKWREVPAPKRGEMVRLIGDEIRKHKSRLGSLVSLEMGKSKQEGDGEVQEMIDMSDFAVGQSRMLYGYTMHSERPQHRLYEQWHPLGIVGVISAFNFPVAVWSWNAFNAAVAGNCVMWKPSPKVPLCAIEVQKLCDRVMAKHKFPNIFSHFITESEELINRFVDDPRVALVSFTGSTAVGAGVAQRVAKRFGRTILECSGNNAVIVDETADLHLALSAVLFGSVGTSGQRCTTTRRVFIHKSIYRKFVAALVGAYKKVTPELTGPLVDAHAVTLFENAIAELRTLNAKLLVGGNRLKRPGYFVQPTIVEARHDWDIVKSETFGPILYIMSYERFEDAIAMQNDVIHGLSSSLFTNSLKNAERFLSAVGSDCGIANINVGTSGAEIGGAFGGEKATGGGREAGSDTWKSYMRRQTTTINWGNELPLAQGIRFKIA